VIPVEAIPGIGVEGMKKSGEGINSCMIYLIYCKNLYKCHNVPPPITTIKEKSIQHLSEFLLSSLTSLQ
jgi:hypothetical protein